MTVVLSASSFNTYQLCALRWWFEYVAAIPTVPSEAMAVGTDVHEEVEKILRVDGADNLDPGDHPDTTIRTLVNVFRKDIQPTYGEILAVEKSFQIEVNGIPFSGQIDAIDLHRQTWGDEVIIRDLKTTGSKPASGKYRFNLIGYVLGAKSLGIKNIIGMQLDYIVRTKKPYYWPEFQQAPPDHEIETWSIALEIVAESIASGQYDPTGLGSYACSWCPFTSECGPYQRYTSISPLREESK